MSIQGASMHTWAYVNTHQHTSTHVNTLVSTDSAGANTHYI
ncbi:hypothetical protein HMPREF3192_00077 [Atopobium deltae]|uniref:Uncharacterized protein n=1 Tax=Atopobium deltae TaxID=1393034 RepID=A0A133XXJ4_9ACTN|nr:hypothetical protein HMPREF3192_00077 [Atopobium deltae]